jgi:A/G-specific adenine glycosylase
LRNSKKQAATTIAAMPTKLSVDADHSKHLSEGTRARNLEKKQGAESGLKARFSARILANLRAGLLDWFALNKRDLPWRRSHDPYAIWVSEIMLQQTRVAVVMERFVAFMTRFPTIESLASAAEEDVLALWSGLGYYRRARMLHTAAGVVAAELGGTLPATSESLRKLPGIGSYTAAAIASIAQNEAVAVVDGNVERVLCRMAGWDATSSSRRPVGALAAELVDPARPGDFNQALMELGATVCLPRNPQCLVCPWTEHCETRGEHKTAARAPMVRRDVGYALVLRTAPVKGRPCRQVLLEQRKAAHTVMPGLWELPGLKDLAFPDDELRMTVRHAIMQVNYKVRIREVAAGDVAWACAEEGERRWVALEEAAMMPLTGLARKVLVGLSRNFRGTGQVAHTA